MKAVDIASLHQSISTPKQQTHIIERLAKLQQSRLFKKPDFGRKLDQLIRMRLSELYLGNDDAALVVRGSSDIFCLFADS